MENRNHIFLFFVFLLFTGHLSFAQVIDSAALYSQPVYTNLDEALKNPDRVYRLNLRGKKLKTFPMDILKLKNLQVLDLGRNKLDSLPEQIGSLSNLQVLDVSSNNLEHFPKAIGELKHLKKLAAGKNDLMDIPREIGMLENLEILDLWSNQISVFPDEMGKLKKLRWMDLRVIQIEDNKQEHLRQLLPNTIIHFSPSCHCVTG